MVHEITCRQAVYEINRIYDDAEADTRKYQAKFLDYSNLMRGCAEHET